MIDLKKHISYSTLKWLIYNGCTDLHFLKVWQKEKSFEETKAQFRGTYLHAAILEQKAFENEYALKPEISAEELNDFRLLKDSKLKPIIKASKISIGYNELMLIKEEESNVTGKKLLSKEEFEQVYELRQNIANDTEICDLLHTEGNVYELKQTAIINDVNVKFIVDCYNPLKGFELDIKTMKDDFISPDKARKTLGQNILQRALYNICLRSMDVKIKNNYILAVDGFMIPKLLRYDNYEIKEAENKIFETIEYFKSLLINGFKGYQYTKDEGIIFPTYILEWQLENLQTKNVDNSIYDSSEIDDTFEQILKNASKQ